jgi:hypothetical protein
MRNSWRKFDALANAAGFVHSLRSRVKGCKDCASGFRISLVYYHEGSEGSFIQKVVINYSFHFEALVGKVYQMESLVYAFGFSLSKDQNSTRRGEANV